METLKINISHIKNIKKAELEVPFDNGIYTFVGANGCGKSFLMLCMAQLLSKYQLRKLQDGDIVAKYNKGTLKVLRTLINIFMGY